MPKIFKDKNNNVLYTGYETSEVVANPTLAGTEANLTGLQVGETKYKVPQGGGGETPHLYEIKVNFAVKFLELTCLSTESINNLDEITDDTVITDDIWNDLIKLKDKIYNIHSRTISDSALLGDADINFVLDKRTGEIKKISIYAVIYYPDSQTQNYNVSGQEINSIDITKLADNQGYEVSCYGTRLPRNITCVQIF